MKVLFTSISFLVLSLLLASCGGGGSSDKGSGSSGSKDEEGPASAPTATAPAGPVGGASYNLSIDCNEAGEVVSITGKGLEPDPQTHTCTDSGTEEFSLSLKQGVNLPSPNNLSLSSMDEHGNSAGDTTIVNVPIDTVAPSVAITAITNGGDIIEGSNASFTVVVTDDSDFVAFTPEVSSGSGSVTSGACSSSPCSVVVSGTKAGTLTLTVAAGDVVDAAGNANTAEASDSLNVQSTTLSVTSAPMGTSLNAASYEVIGTCVANQGDVTVTVATASSVTVDCAGDPGTYTALLDISGVAAGSMSVMAEQSGNTKSLSPSPANDQQGPASAPTATAPALGTLVGGASYNLSIDCNEAGEVVSITGSGLNPDSQTHTCVGSGTENFSLILKQGVSFPSVNNLTLNSTDQYGNPASGTTTVNVPIDTVAPSIAITNGGDIIERNDASFTVVVMNDSNFVAFTPEVSSGNVTSGTCSSSPCSVVVSGALVGTLTLTVAVGAVVDAAGNANTAEASDSLTVIATTLSVTSALMGTSLNAASYPVSGNCDLGEGNVTVTVEDATPVPASCTGDPGTYTASLDISGVTAGSMSVMAEQGGNTANLSPSPANDQQGPASAPTATAPALGTPVGGASYDLVIACSEAGEVVSITGSGLALGLDSNPQTYTCTGSGAETFSLILKQGVSFPSVNNLTLNSTDQYGNPASGTTTVNVPIDTLAPSVAITNGGDITEGSNASFTVVVTDDSDFVAFTPEVSSGSVTSGACSSSPCSVVVSGALVGTLTLTVAVGAVVDAAGNANTAEASNSLTVIATTLSVTSAPMGTSLNAASYPVSGNCDAGQGNVTVTVENANPVMADCTGDPAGTYTALLDISGVTANPMSVTATQGGNTKSLSPSPANDQQGPASAPTATAPAPGTLVGGASYNLSIDCNEAGEVVSITGSGLNPDSQTHTCVGSGTEEFSLSLKQGVNLPSPNNLSLSSMDEHGNPASGTTTVNVPIDTVAPSIAITNGGDIIEGNNASFTVVVMNDSDFVAFTPEVSNGSGSVTSGTCSSSPCSVVVSGTTAGTLTLTVAAGDVVDAAGNANTAEASDSLTVIATTLSVTSAPMGTSLNAASYPVSGNCDLGEGGVKVTVGTASPVTAECTGDPGTYTASLDISGVAAGSMSVMAEQGGNTKSLSPSPANDQQGPASAPTATAPAPGTLVGGASYNLPIVCNEAAEVVSITGDGLNPDTQTYTCTGSGTENFLLGIKQGVSFPSVNNLTLNSTDQYGNPASGATTVNVPIDTLAPSVAITNGGDITEGSNASFTVVVTDDSDFVAFIPEVSSGSVTSGTCSSSPCSVVVSGTLVGTLTLTVAAGDVVDAAGNANTAEASDSLTVIATTLSVTSAPMGTSLNAASYPVSGNCDVGQGDVTVTVENANPVMADCTTGNPGTYTALLDISGVTASPMSVTATQGGNTKNLSPSPANDQNGPTSAPTATGPASAVNVASYDLSIECNEAGEVVSITGSGLLPNPQTHTCAGSGAEIFSLNIKRGVSFSSPNNLMLTSTDQYGNLAGSTTTVNIPIDTLALAPTVVIGSSLPSSIEASNAQSFTVEGTCSEEGEPVMVSVGGVSPEIDPDCTSGAWSVDFDVTGLNKTTGSISVTADHSTPIGEDATQASQSVTNNFICPEDFVGVPSLTGYTTNSFCVMKYEAKNAGAATTGDATDDTPVSQAAGTPWVSINRDSSITKCTDIDSNGKYDLITNDEWQSVARNIELVGSNWANGSVGNAGGLSTGHSDNSPPNTLAANSDDNNACHETGDTCDGSTWHSQKRTHTLSNGEVVWDIAGNVWEWVKDSNTQTTYGSGAYMSQITSDTHTTSGSLSGGTTTTTRTAKGQFGPSGDYTDLDSTPYGGLGHGTLNNFSAVGAVVRGGERSVGDLNGAFAVSLTPTASTSSPSVGFRCVYHP